MRKSILTKTFFTILITIVGVLLIAGLFLNAISENYYYNKKIVQVETASKEIERMLTRAEDDDEISRAINAVSVRTGVDIILVDNEGNIIFSDFMFESQKNNLLGPGQNRRKRLEIIQPITSFITDVRNADEPIVTLIQNTDGKADIYVYGTEFEDGIIAIIQIPVETIDDTVAIIRKIIVLMMIIGVVLGSIAAYMLSKNITKPLLELKEIAEQISELKFDRKYKDNRQDEIGQLGNSLNKLSNELELSITGLQQELEKEKTLDVLRKQFISQVSHEIQTPMAIIKGYVEAIEDGMAETEEEKAYHYQVIREEIAKMTKMTKEMMDLAQLEAGTYNINKKTININKLIYDIGEKYKTYITKEEKGFSYKIPEEKVLVNGDDNRLEQVISNFLKNALIHTKENDRIEVILEEENDMAVVKVKNTGSQIPEIDIDHIWESFYKASNNDTQKGTGLGLAISKHIITLHDGQYGARNLENGVEFWFKIKKIQI